LGTCVFTVFHSVAQNLPYDPDEYSDLIYDLVFNAVKEGQPLEQGNEKKTGQERTKFRKAQIIETATNSFSDKGFLGATISDIAKNAKLADGTLYEYFDTKEDILLSISEIFLQNISSDGFPFSNVHGTEKKLRNLIWRWIWLLWSKKAFARVLTLELFRNLKFYSTPGYNQLRAFFEQIHEVVKQGQAESVFRKGVSVPIFLNMIIGTVDQSLVSHFLLSRPPAEITELHNTVDSLIRAIKI